MNFHFIQTLKCITFCWIKIYCLYNRGANLLTDVFVLIKSLLCQVALAKVHTELQVLEHNWLVYLLPCSMFFALDDIVEYIQSWLLFSNFKKLWKRETERRSWPANLWEFVQLWNMLHPKWNESLGLLQCFIYVSYSLQPKYDIKTAKSEKRNHLIR